MKVYKGYDFNNILFENKLKSKCVEFLQSIGKVLYDSTHKIEYGIFRTDYHVGEYHNKKLYCIVD